MTEMAPEGYVGITPKCLLGFNKNQGEEISLRLRTDDLNGFRKDESIKKTLLHELAHMVHSEHDANFFALDKQLNHEAASLDWTKSKNYVLGGSNFSNHYDEETQFEETNYSGQRLGGGTRNLEANARESLASAAYRRFLSASTYSLEGSQPNPDGGGLDTKSNVIFKMNGSSPCSSRSSTHNDVEPDPDDSHDEEATVPPSQVCKAVQSFDKTDPDCDMAGDYDFSYNFNAIKPDAYGDGTTKRVKLSSPELATKWAYGDGTTKRLKLSSQEVATKWILVSVRGELDPDDQMDEPVAAVCARLHKAIETLRFQVTPAEAASALHTLLRIVRLCWEKFGWNFQKTDELLVPVLKEYNKHELEPLKFGGFTRMQSCLLQEYHTFQNAEGLVCCYDRQFTDILLVYNLLTIIKK